MTVSLLILKDVILVDLLAIKPTIMNIYLVNNKYLLFVFHRKRKKI